MTCNLPKLHIAGKQQGQGLDQAVLVLNHCPIQLLFLYVHGKFPEGDTKALMVVNCGEKNYRCDVGGGPHFLLCPLLYHIILPCAYVSFII